MRLLRPVLLTLVALFSASCVEDPVIPDVEPQYKWACYDDNDPHCLPEEYDPDPDDCADCPGVYLGETFTLASCTGVDYGNDADSDGLEDTCEYELAKAFAPLLSTHPADEDLSRETYWAATAGYSSRVVRMSTTAGIVYDDHVDKADVKIIYLLGYHNDNGNKHACTGDGLHLNCRSHLGDSEFILVNVRYQSGRWRLSSMFTSAHWGAGDFWASLLDSSDYSSLTLVNPVLLPGSFGYPRVRSGISFPGGVSQRHPRVYVALDKHANYNSRKDCNNGGHTSSDECGANVDDVRVTVVRARNVGSSHDQLLDRVASITGSPSFPGHEYLWTRGYGFCGWRLTDESSRNSDYCVGTKGEYGNVLRTFGF